MAKLKDIFKKKEGGTVIGNLFRKVGDTFTGGIVSQLFPKPTDNDIKKDAKVVTMFNDQPSSDDIAAAEAKAKQKEKTKNLLKWIGIGLGSALVLFGAIKLLFKPKKR